MLFEFSFEFNSGSRLKYLNSWLRCLRRWSIVFCSLRKHRITRRNFNRTIRSSAGIWCVCLHVRTWDGMRAEGEFGWRMTRSDGKINRRFERHYYSTYLIKIWHKITKHCTETTSKSSRFKISGKRSRLSSREDLSCVWGTPSWKSKRCSITILYSVDGAEKVSSFFHSIPL